jgi:hypothetical protein
MRVQSRLFASLTALIALTCCTNQQIVQAIDVRAISAVQAEIKRQVGIYMAAAQAPPTVMINGTPTPVSKIENGFWCGSGKIGFDISSIKAELTTTLDSSSDVKLGLSIPVNIVTLGPSAEYKRNVTNTQVLDYNLWPRELARQNSDIIKKHPTDEDIQRAPIAQVLRDLRDALVFSAMKMDYTTNPPKPRQPQPCFTDYNPDKPGSDAGDTFKLGLSITNDISGGIQIKVTVLNFTASGESKSTTGNTLTVAFVQQGLKSLQQYKDAVDAECKYPKSLPNAASVKCQNAKKELEKVESDLGIFLK